MTNVFDNRELSWLKFNNRVLMESNNDTNPLFERYRFLSISANNLDEFYMIRVGSLIDQKALSILTLDSKTNLSADEQLNRIFKETSNYYKDRDRIFESIKSEFKEYKINHLDINSLSNIEKDILKQYFDHEIVPILSPQIVNAKHPFPQFINKHTYLLLSLEKKNKNELGIISLNLKSLPNIFVFPLNKTFKFVLMEDIIYLFGHKLFKEWTTVSKALIRITRNADLDLLETYDNEINDFKESIKQLLKKRIRMNPIRLEVRYELDEPTYLKLKKHLSISSKQRFNLNSPLDFSYLSELENHIKTSKLSSLIYPIQLQNLSSFINHNYSIINQVLKNDLFMSYPFNPIISFINFLKEAVNDPKIFSIKICLYRVASDSRIMNYLIQAAENGKEVIVVMELKARFDEFNNIEWSNKLEEAGCRIIYGVSNLKVHSKVAQFLRKDGSKTQMITHLSTGNYNEKTSQLYTDINILTSNPIIGQDINKFFQSILSDQIDNIQTNMHMILVSPYGIQTKFIELINEEIHYHRLFNNGHIIFKMNSLTDISVMNALIEASKEGVKIELIVRGICCLIPGIEGETENISVRSIIGRYLEHSRIYYFHHNGDKKYYLSSADLMTRNMEKRIEIACPILDKNIMNECDYILSECLKDTVNAHQMNSDGLYNKILDSQEYNSQKNLFTPLTTLTNTIVSKPNHWETFLQKIKSFTTGIE